MDSALPDIVVDTKLDVEVHPGFTIHFERPDEDDVAARPVRSQAKWKQSRHPIASGGFGKVWLHQCVSGHKRGQTRAVKEVELEGPHLQSVKPIRELEAIGKFSQRRSFGWYETGKSLFVMMEYLDKGDLGNYLERPLPEVEAAGITQQLLEGLGYMHGSGFAHRDLKPQNILVKVPGPDWWVKIADFGIAKRQTSGNATTAIGSGIYMAPEKHGWFPGGKPCETPATAADMWAVGIIAWLLVANKQAFGPNEVASYVILEKTLSLRSKLDISSECRDFVTSMLAGSASKRPRCHDAAAHTWIQTHRPSDEPEVSDELDDDLQTLDMSGTKIKTSEYGSLTTKAETVLEQPITVAQRPPRHSNANGASKSPPSAVSSRESSEERTILKDSGFFELRAQLEEKNYRQAEEGLMRALSYLEEHLGSHHRYTMRCLDLFSESLFQQGKYSDAERCLRQAYNGRLSILGIGHDDTLATARRLGCALYELERFRDAAMYWKMVFKGREKLFGPRDRRTVQSAHELASAMNKQRKHGDAEVYGRIAFESRRLLYGEHHEDTVASAMELAVALLELNNFGEAAHYSRIALAGWEKILGSDNEMTLAAAHLLAESLYETNDLAGAERCYRKAAAGRARVMGRLHKDTLSSVHGLGRVYYKQGGYAAAVVQFEHALMGRRKIFREDDLQVLNCYFWLGLGCYKIGRLAEAENCLRQAMAGSERSGEGQHPEAAVATSHILGMTLLKRGDSRKALDHLKIAVKGYETVSVDGPLGKLEAYHWLGVAQLEQEENLEAIGSLRQALEGREVVLGISHPLTNETRRLLETAKCTWMTSIGERDKV